MDNENIEYTSNEELCELVDKDPTVEVIGYVDEISSPAVVGPKKDIHIFKFTITNGEKRLPVVIWGQELINKYEHSISMNKIIHITRGESKLANPRFIRDKERCLQFEITVHPRTVLNFLGNHSLNGINAESEPQRVTFENVGLTTGLITLRGHLKLQFELIPLRGLASYGEGVITDGSAKVIVKIANYNDLKIELGTCIDVTGELKDGTGATIIYCTDNSAIKPVPEVPVMDPKLMRWGVKSPKRGRDM